LFIKPFWPFLRCAECITEYQEFIHLSNHHQQYGLIN
jgi:hypothetical protein